MTFTVACFLSPGKVHLVVRPGRLRNGLDWHLASFMLPRQHFFLEPNTWQIAPMLVFLWLRAFFSINAGLLYSFTLVVLVWVE